MVLDHRHQVIPVGRLAPGDQWDQNLLDLLFDNHLYPTGLQFKRVDGYPPKSGGILLVPGRYWHERIHDIDDAISSHKWVLLMRVGDEEDTFDVNQVAHPNIKFWLQQPRTDKDYGDARLFGCGFTPHFNSLPAEPSDKSVDLFLSAQNTHPRRRQAFTALAGEHPGWRVEATEGFTKGLTPEVYRDAMIQTKVAPAPSGPYSADTFRLFEALEAHCVPIADDRSPQWKTLGYWQKIFGECPFPVLHDYADLPNLVEEALKDWPANANRIAAWWMRYKRQLARWLVDDLKKLGAL
jgi:hypothetical protein